MCEMGEAVGLYATVLDKATPPAPKPASYDENTPAHRPVSGQTARDQAKNIALQQKYFLGYLIDIIIKI